MLFQAMVQWNLMGSLALPSYHFAHLLEEDTDNLLGLLLDRALAEVAFHIAYQTVVQVAFHIAYQAVVQVAFHIAYQPVVQVAFHIASQAVVQVAFHIAFQTVVQVAFQVVIKPQDLLDTVHTLVQLDLLLAMEVNLGYRQAFDYSLWYNIVFA